MRLLLRGTATWERARSAPSKSGELLAVVRTVIAVAYGFRRCAVVTLLGRARVVALAVVAIGMPALPASTIAASPSPAAHHVSGTQPDLSSPAAELRIALDRLLAEHAFLTIEQMRSGLAGAPDFAAAAAAVEGNSVQVAAAIGSIYGEEAVEPFGEIWRSHIGYLVDFAVGMGDGDAAAQQQALQGLADYRQRLRTFLTDANPGVALDAIVEALDMHTAQLVEFITAVHAGDHTTAFRIEREAYPHMFDLGDALARVIANRFPDRYTGIDVAYSSAGTLRVTLDRILGEHAFLAAGAMRSGVVGSDDFGAAAEAIAGNSDDLQAVVAAAYGDEAAGDFRELWDAHITAYVQYIQAARANDLAARDAANAVISDYARQLAAFLTSANPHLDAASLTTLFQDHAAHLSGQVEAFAAGDYDTTYALVRTGYEHMFTVGEALAIGIATQMPKKFPADSVAPSTDTDPHAGHGGGDWTRWLVPLVLAAGVALIVGMAALRRGALVIRRPR